MRRSYGMTAAKVLAAGLAGGLLAAVMGTGVCARGQDAAPVTPSTNAKKKDKPIDPETTAGVRGPGILVTIHVRSHGKPVADALVVVKTEEGVEVRQGQTDAAGVWRLKLENGDYVVSATSAESEQHITAHIAGSATVHAVVLTVTIGKESQAAGQG